MLQCLKLQTGVVEVAPRGLVHDEYGPTSTRPSFPNRSGSTLLFCCSLYVMYVVEVAKSGVVSHLDITPCENVSSS